LGYNDSKNVAYIKSSTLLANKLEKIYGRIESQSSTVSLWVINIHIFGFKEMRKKTVIELQQYK